MRRFRLGIAMLTLCVPTACGQPDPTATTPSAASSLAKVHVNPLNISRVRSDLPAGYEVADIVGPSSPAAFWGLRPGWITDPPQCAALAGPPTDDATTKGWSGSGAGGIIHAVVTGSPSAPVHLDSAVLADCGHYTVTSGNTTGTVDLVDAPIIDDATTVGMDTIATTVVEGGTQTTSAAYTFAADLGTYLAFVTVVTDPGSPNPSLGQDFASDLLVKTVAALRE